MLRRTALALGALLLAAANLQPFQAPPAAPFGVEVALLDSTLESPVALAFAPDGRLFIAEQGGQIKIYKDGAMNASPYASVSPIYSGAEAGLLGLCLDPDFEANGYLYVFVTRTSGVQQIVRYTSNGDTGSDPTVIVDNIPSAGYYHNGGGIGFGPDGYLYAVVGENGYTNDAQVAASWRGKVLRFDVSTVPASIPDSNPTAGSAVYSLGHRHPFRLTFRPGTGALYVSENGPSVDDEINVISPGANYGWPNDTGPNASGAYTDPVFTFSDTIAITDMLFYTGSQLPYAGDLFYVDYKNWRIRRLEVSDSGEQITGGPYDFLSGVWGAVDIEQGPDGEIYFCAHYSGELYRTGAPTPKPQPSLPDPLTVKRVYPLPDSQLTSAPTKIRIDFSTTVDAATVTGSTISLLRAGPDGAFDTADDVIITPASVSIKHDTVTLDLTGASLPAETFRIRVSGGDGPPSSLPGLFAHWKLDEGSGATTADSSGNGHQGALDGPVWATGIHSKAIRFGGDGDRVDIDAGTLPPSWTAAMWVYRSSDVGQKDNYFDPRAAALMDARTESSGTSLRLEHGWDDKVGITLYGVYFDNHRTAYEAPIGSWIHLTFTSDASNARIYVNGVLAATLTRAFDLTLGTLGTADVIRSRSLDGLLDEVQIYDRVLSEAEIASLAVVPNLVRSDSGAALDGDFSGQLPSGDGNDGGDFISSFTIVEPVAAADDDDDGCGLLGMEGPVLWALILLFRSRRRR